MGLVDRVAQYGLKDGKVFDDIKNGDAKPLRDEGTPKALFRSFGVKQLLERGSCVASTLHAGPTPPCSGSLRTVGVAIRQSGCFGPRPRVQLGIASARPV